MSKRAFALAVLCLLVSISMAPAVTAQTWSRNVLWRIQEPDATTFRNAIAFSPDGQLVATGRTDSNTVTLRDASDGHLVRTLLGENNNARALAFSPDASLLATGTGMPGQTLSLNLWRVSDGVRLKGRVAAHPNGTSGVVFSPDGGDLATCGFHDRTVKVWPVPALEDPTLISNFDPTLGYSAIVHSIAWSPDGQLLAVGDARGVKLRRPQDGAIVREIPEPAADIVSLAFSPDGQFVAAGVMHQDPTYGTCTDCMVRLWRVADGALVTTFRAESGNDFLFPQIAFTPDGTFIGAGASTGPAGAETGIIQFWKVATGQAVFVDRRPSSVHAFAVGPDSERYGYVLANGLVAVARLP
jgi:WD40 repeat protein